MDVGCLDLAGMKQQLRLAVELAVAGLEHGNTLLGLNIAKPNGDDDAGNEEKKKKRNKTFYQN